MTELQQGTASSSSGTGSGRGGARALLVLHGRARASARVGSRDFEYERGRETHRCVVVRMDGAELQKERRQQDGRRGRATERVRRARSLASHMRGVRLTLREHEEGVSCRIWEVRAGKGDERGRTAGSPWPCCRTRSRSWTCTVEKARSARSPGKGRRVEEERAEEERGARRTHVDERADLRVRVDKLEEGPRVLVVADLGELERDGVGRVRRLGQDVLRLDDGLDDRVARLARRLAVRDDDDEERLLERVLLDLLVDERLEDLAAQRRAERRRAVKLDPAEEFDRLRLALDAVALLLAVEPSDLYTGRRQSGCTRCRARDGAGGRGRTESERAGDAPRRRHRQRARRRATPWRARGACRRCASRSRRKLRAGGVRQQGLERDDGLEEEGRTHTCSPSRRTGD